MDTLATQQESCKSEPQKTCKHSIFEEAALFAQATGREILAVNGKKPAKGFHNPGNGPSNSPKIIRSFENKYPDATGWAAYAGSEYIVIDIDTWKWGKIPDELQNITTWITLSGNYGFHYWFLNPLQLPNSSIKKFDGVDIRSGKNYLVMPGSVHPITNLPYTWKVGHSYRDIPCAVLPASILSNISISYQTGTPSSEYVPSVPTTPLPSLGSDSLHKLCTKETRCTIPSSAYCLSCAEFKQPPTTPSEIPVASESAIQHTNTISIEADSMKEADSYEAGRSTVMKMKRSIQGKGGHKQLFKVASVLTKGYGYSDEVSLNILQEWNEECIPPWNTKELMRAINSSRAKSKLKPFTKGKQSSQISAELLHWLNELEAQVNSCKWDNNNDKLVISALIDLGKQVGSTQIIRSVRKVSLDSGVSKKTVSASYYRLLKAGWLAKVNRKKHDKGSLLWKLQAPIKPTNGTAKESLAIHDIWSRKGLGLTAKSICEALHSESAPITVKELQDKYNFSYRTLCKYLPILEKHNLAMRSKDKGVRAEKWQAIEPDHIDDLAVELGISGYLADLQVKRDNDYRNDREKYEEQKLLKKEYEAYKKANSKLPTKPSG